jgi:hypothetical protein
MSMQWVSANTLALARQLLAEADPPIKPAPKLATWKPWEIPLPEL